MLTALGFHLSYSTIYRKESIGVIEKLPAELLPTLAQLIRHIQISSPQSKDGNLFGKITF
jgi:hypothetical protein